MAASKPLTIARLNDAILGAVGRNIPPSEGLDHTVRFLSTWSGSDKWFMLIQYVAKLLVPILNTRARMQNGGGSKAPGVSSVAEACDRLAKLIGDSRTLWRIWGLLPILQWLASLERSSPPPTRLLLTIERLQGLSMLIYYPLEHAYYLAGHSILPLSAAQQTKYALWSCRAWAAYVMLQFIHLREDWRLVKKRERALSRDFALGTVEKTSTEAETLREEVRKRKDAIWNELVVNVGYLPLTVHWSLEKGLFKSDFLVSLFGLVAGVASFRGGWIATARPVRV